MLATGLLGQIGVHAVRVHDEFDAACGKATFDGSELAVHLGTNALAHVIATGLDKDEAGSRRRPLGWAAAVSGK